MPFDLNQLTYDGLYMPFFMVAILLTILFVALWRAL